MYSQREIRLYNKGAYWYTKAQLLQAKPSKLTDVSDELERVKKELDAERIYIIKQESKRLDNLLRGE